MVEQRYLEVRFNPDRTFNATMLMDRFDALTVVSALIRQFELKPKEIELSNELDQTIHGQKLALPRIGP
jgi:hypothetical protein